MPRTPRHQGARQQRARLHKEWSAAREVFRTFQTVAAERRFHHLGLLFEHLAPWIERAIRTVVLRHFLLLPTEMVLARIFAKAARREELPASHEAFALWVESVILQDLADPSDELGATNGAAGEPSAALQQRFNELPFQDRALLYLYMVERCSLGQVARRTGIPAAEAAAALNRIWAQVGGQPATVRLPLGWRAPDNPLAAGAAGAESAAPAGPETASPQYPPASEGADAAPGEPT